MDLDGACGLWDSIRAELYSLVAERRHPPHAVDLCKQVNAGRGVVLKQARSNRGVKVFEKTTNQTVEKSLNLPGLLVG